MKPSLTISIVSKTVTFDGEEIPLLFFSSGLEFADHIVDKYEHLWSAEETNETRKQLTKLYDAVMEV